MEEFKIIENLVQRYHARLRVRELGRSVMLQDSLPVLELEIGNEDREAPVFGLIGGVHGLERIGSQVVLALARSLLELSTWDRQTQEMLKTIRVFFIPMVNPVGILKRRRSNPRGVDIMRNSPVQAEEPTPWLVGGQRLGPWLPWFRGGQSMEPETEMLIEAVRGQIRGSRLSLTIDFHSGFGFQDQIWFPYARTSRPPPGLGVIHALYDLFCSSHPHHFYKFGPQPYRTHGDVWDFLFDEAGGIGENRIYLPLALEMGSWNWIKKNPIQLFSLLGPFNPVKVHRHRRTLRRHQTFFDFILRAMESQGAWAGLDLKQIRDHERRALTAWYGFI